MPVVREFVQFASFGISGIYMLNPAFVSHVVQCFNYVDRGHHGAKFSDCATITEAAQPIRSYTNVFKCNARKASTVKLVQGGT
jgi:hypothetical protein